MPTCRFSSLLRIEFLAAQLRGGKRMQDEATYVCEACGEEIVVPIDLSAGESQEYVEDCPVCCRPNLVHVEIDEDGRARVWGEKESG
jgi:DNA replicative helicase MCM subunit Mcm2 (Cdc46/Mcm family)